VPLAVDEQRSEKQPVKGHCTNPLRGNLVVTTVVSRQFRGLYVSRPPLF
jgi:hypothetical protein